MSLFYIIYSFIFGCAGSSLLCGLSLAMTSGAYSTVAVHGVSCCSGFFSCCRAWALGHSGSVVVACGLSSCSSQALEQRLDSCGPNCSVAHEIFLDLVSNPCLPALAGGVFTTEPPGKPPVVISCHYKRCYAFKPPQNDQF